MEGNTSNTDDSTMDKDQPPPEKKERKLKSFHLFNCDKTYNLDIVEKLLDAIKGKLTSFDISTATKTHFGLSQMSELCTTIKSGPPMDFAIFVVHANESRLSINEENAGIGYARFYKALQQATDDRVIVVIGGDDNYKGPAEEESALLSRWAWRQISSQFKEEYKDGRKSFIFSWRKNHRTIHEEALLHFLDPGKSGQKFVREIKHQPTTPSVDPTQKPKSQETGEVHPEAKTERNSSNFQQMKDGTLERQNSENGREQVSAHQSSDGKKVELDKPVNVTHADAMDVPREKESSSKPEKAENTPPLGKQIAIFCRDQSDIAIIKELFGDELLNILVNIFSGPPEAGAGDVLFSAQSIRSCFIVVEAKTMKEEQFQHKSAEKSYENLLRKAGEAVDKKVVIIICNDKGNVSHDEEDAITDKINQLLGEKGVIFWWKGNKHSLHQTRQNTQHNLRRSKSLPSYEGAAKSMELDAQHPINPEEFTLLLETRLHRGTISYLDKDVKERLEGWAAPEDIAKNLLKEWQSTAEAELLIYRENKTGNDRVVVRPVKGDSKIKSQISEGFKDLKDTWNNVKSEARSVLGDLGEIWSDPWGGLPPD